MFGLGHALKQRRVFGFDLTREARICQGVFVPAADARCARQGAQPVERGEHLLGCAFEHASAAQAEQGIAAEQTTGTDEGDMAARMAGNRQNIELEIEGSDADPVAVVDHLVDVDDAFVARRVAGQLPALPEFACASDVVGVMMREQHRHRLQPARAGDDHGFRVTRVDHHRASIIGDETPDVVVGEGRQGVQCEHGRESRRGYLRRGNAAQCPASAGLRSLTMPPLLAERQPKPGREGWLASPLALALQREEQQQSIPRLTAIYGSTGLYLRGAEAAAPELSGNMQQQVLRLHRSQIGWDGDLRCLDDALPIARESVDLAYLLHVFEDCAQPDDLLHELDRVLAPEGQIMVIGLNPWSPWRWRWTGSGLRVRSAVSLRESLRDAGFEVTAQQGVGPRCPWSTPRPDHTVLRRSDERGVFRAGYLLQARKRRIGVTPLPARGVALQADMRPG